MAGPAGGRRRVLLGGDTAGAGEAERTRTTTGHGCVRSTGGGCGERHTTVEDCAIVGRAVAATKRRVVLFRRRTTRTRTFPGIRGTAVGALWRRARAELRVSGCWR